MRRAARSRCKKHLRHRAFLRSHQSNFIDLQCRLCAHREKSVRAMKRFIEIQSLREGWPIIAFFSLATLAGTFGSAEALSWLIDYPVSWKQYVLRVVIPLLITPAVVIPLLLMSIRLNKLRSEMDRLARTDALTGLPNRRAFFARANEIFALLQGHEPAAVLMVDIDRFKAINDTFGHDAGDAVLKGVAQTILAVAAECGAHRALAARIGGEEFAVVIDRFDAAEATALAEKICQRVRACATVHRTIPISATVSVGVASRQDAEPIDVVLKAADGAVYEAKHAGRDRVCVASDATIASGKRVSRDLRNQPRAA
jgi:diguanylate cyclase (GGDEF)-like protein